MNACRGARPMNRRSQEDCSLRQQRCRRHRRRGLILYDTGKRIEGYT